jgi:hypothetical protein
MRNWKTLLAGSVASLGTYLSSVGEPAWVAPVGQVMSAAGTFMLGATAKDFNVSGTGK